MPLLKIQSYPGVKEIFIASEAISDLATVELVVGPGRRVAMGSTTRQELAAGVARGAAVSGAIVRVVTHGIVSGVKADQDVNAGDRLAIATSGMVTPFNTITPEGNVSGNITGAISGYVPINLASGGGLSGMIGVGDGPALVITSGGSRSGVTGVQFCSGGLAATFGSGLLVGTAFNTGRVVGKALTSGLSGVGIQMIVSLG